MTSFDDHSMRSRAPLLRVLLTVCLGPAVCGCLHGAAKTVAEAPLVTPPAPPRIVETVEVAPLGPAPLVEEPPRQPIRPPAARPQPRADPATPARAQEPPKPEAPPVEPPPVAEAPPKAPPTLQTTPSGAEGELERAIRAVLVRANGDLNRVDYRLLNTDARSQYDTAKRFIRQAEDAMRPPRNLVFARSLADKASTLAAQLAGR